MSDFPKLLKLLIQFRDERDWEQFHNPKDLALALSIEAAELNEVFLWKHPDELDEVNTSKVKQELADIFAYAILLADKYNFDIEKIVEEKIALNAEKYPIDKAKGSAKKYDEL